MRLKLKRALIDLIDYHDEALAEHFAEGKLALESYKEYIELFARSLKETMESREGIAYLLRAAGFEVPPRKSISRRNCVGNADRAHSVRACFSEF